MGAWPLYVKSTEQLYREEETNPDAISDEMVLLITALEKRGLAVNEDMEWTTTSRLYALASKATIAGLISRDTFNRIVRVHQAAVRDEYLEMPIAA